MLNRKKKMFTAMAMSIIMVSSMIYNNIAYAITKDEVESTKELILNYEFNKSDFKDSSTIFDLSGNENNGIIRGDGAIIQDNVLTLPGGNAGSNAAYVQLPTAMLDNKDTLTISVWLKNETGAENYAAMFFGTTESLPKQYWLLNPSAPNGCFKSVFTDSVNASSPWTTEKGIASGTKTDSNWGLYTTVIEEGSISAYYNGEFIGKDNLSRTVSDFGTNLVAYIGRSSYNDKFYKGGVKSVKVYDGVLSASDIKEEYFNGAGEEAVNKALLEDSNALILSETTLIEDITLPTKGSKNSSKITWMSSDEAHITNEGVVIRPTEGDKVIKLTATLTLAGISIEKEFEVTVLSTDPKNDVDKLASSFKLNVNHVTNDIELPTTAGKGSTITWTSSNEEFITSEGKVTRPAIGEGEKEVTLTAVIELNGKKAVKEFMITVIDEYYGYLMSYIKSGDTVLGNSLHLAYSLDGSNYTELNSNRGICFARNTSTSKNDNSNGFKSPFIFRKNDGSYGLIATNNDKYSYVYILESKDLINFTNETKLTLNYLGKKVLNPECYYDSSIGEYVINWTDGTTKYRNTTKDFINVSEAVEVDYEATNTEVKSMPSDAITGNVIQLTKSEYTKVVNKLGVVTNTDIEDVTLEVAAGEEAELPKQVTGYYSDGSTAALNVSWNEEELGNIDFNKPGTYEVSGTVSRKEYDNPFIEQKADPWITKGSDEYYYFTASYPMYGSGDSNGYSKITLRRSETIEGLQNAEEVTIWDSKNSANIHRYIWAPEIHEINGKWYVYFTGSTSSNVWGIRPHVLECTGDNIMDASSWTESGVFQTVEGDDFSFKDFSLDMTYFENNGIHYVIWAQKGTASDLYMATINPDEPWKLTSKPMLLTTPEYSWERINENVNEGPAVIKREGKVFVYFSAAATGVEYCMGVLAANADSDLMNPNSWVKTPYPILTSDDVPGEYGPGHNSFTVDENGNDVFVYHARSQECYENKCEYSNQDPLYDPCRHSRVKNVHWAADGTPILKMTNEQAVSEENENITAVITVQGENETVEGAILHYDMTVENGVVVDKAGNNNGEVKNLKDEDINNGTLLFNNDSDPLYIEIPDGTVGDAKDITMSAVVNWKGGVNASWLYTLGTNSGKYLFVTPSNNSNRLQTGFASGSNLNGWETEKGVGGTERLDFNAWSVVTITFDSEANTLSLYKDGKLIGKNTEITYELADIITSGKLDGYIGKSFYSSDPYFSGEIADFKMFNRALTEDEVATLKLESDSLILGFSVDTLSYEYILKDNDSKNNVTSDLNLPTTLGSVEVKWNSSDENIISTDGKVTRPVADESDAEVTLTATMTLNGATRTKVFKVKVIKDFRVIDKLNIAKENLTVNNIEDVRGNLTLPSQGEYDSIITWESSNESIITSNANGDTPAGVVVRQDEDIEVKLIATLTLEGETVTKEFTAKVKAKVGELNYGGYIFTYFIGENYSNGEQIYLGTSKDGLNWEEVNNNEPILTSDLGEKGLRDPFIIRSPEGDKFYLIATDLRIYNGNGWGTAQSNGSKSIMIWESTDLVNWSDQRMVEVAIDTAGCTWAPEAFYDETTGEYIVFWASKDTAKVGADGYNHHRIYYSKTRDFYTFTKPEVYQSIELGDNNATDVIDTTIIENEGTYYRITKNENTKKVFMEKSDSVLGEWTLVDSNITEFAGVEGPTIFKFYDRDEWCLLLDEYSGVKYFPSVTTDLNGGQFRRLDTSEYSLPKGASTGGPRHGTVIPVTQEEYNNIMIAYGNVEILDDSIPKAVLVTDEEFTLPTTIDVKIGEETISTEVKWEINQDEFKVPGIATVKGTLIGYNKEIEKQIRVVSPNLIYFIDSGVSTSEAYEDIKSVVNLRNEVSDKEYSEGSWGYNNPEDFGIYERESKDEYSYGLWARSGKDITYTIDLEAGEYSVTAGFQEWWNVSRAMNFYVEYENENGELEKRVIEEDIKISDSLKNKSTGVFTILKDTAVTFRVTKYADSSDPVLSWLSVDKLSDDTPEIIPVDKTLLKEAIKLANEVNTELYTEESVKVMKEALLEAGEVYNKADARQDEVDAARAKLQLAIEDLEEKEINDIVDKSDLIRLVEEIEFLDSNRYTKDSWKVVKKALDEAKKVIHDEKATKDDVSKTYDNLSKAYVDLELKPSKVVLEEKIQEVEILDGSKYTAKSWKVLEEALEDAKKVLADGEATEKEIEKAVEKLEKAKNTLKENIVADNNTSDESNNGTSTTTKPDTTTKPNNNTKLPQTGSVTGVLGTIVGLALGTTGVRCLKKKKQ